MDFRILGPVEVRIDDSPLPLEGPKQRITLAALLTVAGDVAPLDRLIDWLWGRRPPRSAATIVQAHVSRLRRLLDPSTSRGVSRRSSFAAHPATSCASNRTSSTRCGSSGSSAGAGPRWSGASSRMPRGCSPVRSPCGAVAALADVAFVEAAQVEVVRLEALRMGATTALVDAELALGRHDELVPRLEALVQEHPFDERLSGQLMIALWRAGRQADSLKVYERVRARLARELRISPSPASQRIAAAILAQDPELGLIRSCAFTGRRG